ncbi:MAG: hypothetical protein U9R75_08280 [Candidatus Thermoplasmatota archaeon]|nr:hypothetical protein [Candidatus Thermoplasmatota archaeon]
MGFSREYDQMHSPKGFPYQDALLPILDLYSYKPSKCLRCGCAQSTTYLSILTETSDRSILSGDLTVKSLKICKCMNCGEERPVNLNEEREA